ncbi:MAG TPA: hypothetical protein VHG72_19730, partial [Polyangia bacterium]|nr:hypothetical protein [Polyangia bacterium]
RLDTTRAVLPPAPSPAIGELATLGESLRRAGGAGARAALALRLDRARESSAYRDDAERVARRLPMVPEIAQALGAGVLEVFDEAELSGAGVGRWTGMTLKVAPRFSDQAIAAALVVAARARGAPIAERPTAGLRCFEMLDGAVPRAFLVPATGVLVAAERRSCAASDDWDGPAAPELPDGELAMLSLSDAPVGGAPPTEDLSLGGHPLPRTLTVVLQPTLEPTLDLVAEFAQDAGAQFWSTRWPALDAAARAALLGWPRPSLPLVADAAVTRDGNKIRIQETMTREALAGSPLVAAAALDRAIP